MISWDPLSAFLVIVAPIPALVGSLFHNRIGWQIEQRRVGKVRFVDYVEGLLTEHQWLPEIRLLAAGGLLAKMLRESLTAFSRQDVSILRRRWLVNMALVGVAASLTGGAYMLAIVRSLEAGNVGQFAGFMVGAASVQAVCQQVLVYGADLYGHRLRLASFFAFLDLPGDRGSTRVLPDSSPMIEFEDVWFTYPNTAEPTLRGMSFRANRGQVVAITGPNGSGKSTVLKLLLGTYRPDRGRVLLNGRVLNGQESTQELVCSVVFQQQLRFVGTVRDNVTGYAATAGVDDSRIWAILDQLELKSRIEALDDGLDTLLGREFGGLELSVGEWQRLALARARYHAGHLLLLDEPSSAADSDALAALGRLLGDSSSSRTTLVVTHDPEVVKHADLRLVMQAGRVERTEESSRASRTENDLIEDADLGSLNLVTASRNNH